MKYVLWILTISWFFAAYSNASIVGDAWAIPPHANAIVSQQPVQTSLPQFRNITDALQSIPQTQSTLPWTIYVTSGIYRERLVIEQSNIHLIGQERDSAVIVASRYAGQPISPASSETWGTGRTATVEIKGQNITLENLTVKNDFDFLANDAKSDNDPTKVSGTQAVALKTEPQSDRVYLKNLALISYQDTLYLKGTRTLIKGGMVSGNIDFIFGEGTALFEDVALISRARTQLIDKKAQEKTEKKADNSDYSGYITAPSTNIHRPFGFTFLRCRLEREKGVPDNSVALGRPWHPTTTFTDGRYADPFAIGKATFINTYMANHIALNRWTSMSGTTPSGDRKAFSPHTEARFAEYQSFGDGAMATPDYRHILDDNTAAFYSRTQVLRGWLPSNL